MTSSLNFVALPSIHRISKRENNKFTITNKSKQYQIATAAAATQQRKPLEFKLSFSHARTSSVPSELPSYQHQKASNSNKLSMDVLLDAIDLDQQMRQFFKTEVIKSKGRTTTTQFMPTMMMARRRSKSAPGAPPSYHQQRAFNARWYIQDRVVTSDSQAQDVAKLIVQQHFESIKKR